MHQTQDKVAAPGFRMVVAAVTAAMTLASLPVCVMPRARAADTADTLLPDPRETARVEAAIDRALDYLAKQQKPDGSFPSAQNYNGVSGLCLLAFLARGHEPGRGPYRAVVDRAVAYLVSQQRADGYIPDSMYNHALSTLALIEAYGFIPSLDLHRAVQKAVDLIVKAQAPPGGWRYMPNSQDSDLSVTVMQIVALRAAQNARLDVPQSTIDRATKYVLSVADPNGGFGYQSPAASVAQSAAGTLSLQLLGQHDAPQVGKGLAYLAKNPLPAGVAWFYYANYYTMQAEFQAGGDDWNNWHPRIRDLLLKTQGEDGTWPGYQEEAYNGPAKTYSTSLGSLILSVYLHYLPAYQR
ncbi:MAG: terpene cyclase/mutase family protein [Planctomycetes bacterium]|nr:terpene cyclase/mutase family protein [Planctomycetota bacterium]